MKKPTTLKKELIVLLILLFSIQLFAQNQVPFTPRFNQDLKGDIILIGNNILGPNNNDFNNNSTYNDEVNMRYIDIDSDGTTFSSSSADLQIPINPHIPPAANDCYEIVHAGLYWSAVTDGAEPINTVKLRGPTGGYNDITGTVIFNAGSTSVDGGNSFPYACYADVTNIIRALGTDQGTYTVANVSSSQGQTELFGNFTGNSAGWSLFIVYQNPSLPGKSITSFDGFSTITRSTPGLDVTVSGFRTVPAPAPVRANFAFAALEGDKPITGDRLIINGTRLSDLNRDQNNFFNSSVTGPPVRVPNSSNALGFDTGILAVPNPANAVINNDDTSATVRLETGRDTYFPYFFAFAVDIIAPNMVLTKTVEDEFGNNIGGGLVDLGDELNYVIGFQNTGNDDATGLTIRDVLPTNIEFNYPADMGLLPPGLTVQSYNPATRELIFAVDDSVIEENDPVLEIRFKVTVVRECSLLNDACDNIVSNQAFSTYRGTLNPLFVISDDPSFSTNTGCLLIPGATNFIADIDCTFEEDVILCGDNVVLTAGDDYDSYLWSTGETTQSITVTAPGTYTVRNTATAPCQSIDQIFNVITYGAGVPNPVIPFADQVVVCPDDGTELPNIFMCGASDTTFIDTNITDANSIIWQRLDESSCTAVADIRCPNVEATCTWNTVQTGPDYLVDTAGQYRLTLNYTGGCFNEYYFNVYENVLLPTATSNDIICTTPGEIVVADVPSGYEYSIDNVNFQPSNVFSITTAGIYTVYIRQIGVTPNPCVFTIPDIQIRERNFTVTTDITQPLCHNGQGSVLVAANDVRPQYYFSISQGATLINSVGPIVASDYTFPNLNPGTYTIDVTTDDGCVFNGDIDIINPTLLEATAALTSPLTCTDGEITVYPVGGTSPYFYFVNSTTVFQTLPQIPVTAAGTYDIRVVDSNNCFVDISIDVDAIQPPAYTVSKTDILCAGTGNVGEIDINVTNANGNTLRYSIDNGATYSNSPVFTGLAVGSYEVLVEYTSGTDVCVTAPQTIDIIELSAITGTATLTTPYTCTTNGEITVSGVSGGTAPYSYSIDGINFQPGLTFTGLTDGSYTVTIRDANNCTFTAPAIDINPLDPPTNLTFSNTALTCPTNESDVTITTTTGGTAPLEYRIIAPAPSVTGYQSSITFTGLAPAIYTFEVRDANNCTYSESYEIEALPALTVVGALVNNITCFGASDGAVRFTVAGTTGFTYTINGGTSTAGTSPIDLTGLSAGPYAIVVTDTATNCQATASVTVDAPPAALSVTVTESPITCLADGSVIINAVGGWGGNSYTLTQPDTTVLGPQGSNTFGGLTQAGTYTATVTDSNGCTATDTFTLSLTTLPVASIDVTSDLCYDTTNAATLVATVTSGGQAPFEYNINGGPFGSSNTFTGLTPGSYTIIVRDAYGCQVTLPAQTIAPQLTLSAVLTKDIDCSAAPDALITGNVSGGTPPYEYTTSFNGGAYNPLSTAIAGTTFVRAVASPGDYRFRVTDAQGCQVESGVVTVNPAVNPTATVTTVNPTCNGGANGSVQITASGGEGPYEYSFNGSAFTTTSFYDTLSASIVYAYQVRDSKECLFNGTVTLTEPDALAATHAVTPFSCSATNTSQPATITVTATDGTAPYQFSFNGSGYSATNTFNVNDDGTNQTIPYSVRDNQGCIFNSSVTINALNPPMAGTITSTPVTCINTTSTATVTPAVGTGVGALTYEITLPAAFVASNGTGIFPGLDPDITYTFRVTDADGCYYTETHRIEPVVNIAVTGALVNDVSCNGGTDGAVTFTVSNFATTYSYTINGVLPATTGQSAVTIPLTLLPAGDQVIVVTDETTGCTDTFTVPVSEPAAALGLSATSTNVFCTNDNSQITVTATDGTPNYTYAAVITGAGAPAIGAYSSGNVITVDTNSAADLVWDVYVRDANDCIEMTTVTIVSDPLPTVSTPALASNQCSVTSGFTFTATPGAGAITPLTYSIDGGTSYQTSPTFTVNGPGTYTVTIRDGNGCTATSATTTEVFAPVTAGAILTKDLTCSVPQEATMDITVSGGNTPYSYRASIGGVAYAGPQIPIVGSAFTYTPVSLVGTTYQFEITDANGCTVETNIITTNTAVNPVITSVTQTQFISCFGDPTAAIDIIIDNTVGLAPYTINVNNDTTTTNYGTQTSGLPAGSYTITVTDANGCTDTDTIAISEPSAINTLFTAVPITCFGGGLSSGSITVDGITGGTAPYNIFVTGTGAYSNSALGVPGTAAVPFTVIDFGLYQISVVDANGCTQLIQDVLVASPPTDLDITVNTLPTICTTGGTAVVTIGGTLTGNGPYHFAIYTGPGMTYSAPTAAPWQDEDAFGSETSTFTGLLPGVTYTFIIYDEFTQCYYFETSTIPIPTNSTLTTTAVVENNITCTGSADGNVSFDINSTYLVTTDVTYTVFNSLTLATTGITGSGTVPASGTLSVSNLGPLPVGNYFVVVEEDLGATNAGCSVSTTTFSITESAALLTISAAVSKNANCNELGTITATAANGTGPYEYQAVVSGSPVVPANWAAANTFNLAGTTTYDIYVRDAYGCVQFATQVLPTDQPPTISPVAQQCYTGTPINITLSGTVFVGTAAYSINGVAGPYQASPNFTIASPGTYTLSIRDDNGCTATTSYVVEPQLLLNANMTQDLECQGVDASITLTPTGGVGPYTLEVSFNSGGFIPAVSPFTTSVAGDYVFRVTDSQGPPGCPALSNTVTVTPRTTPTLTEVHTDVTCIGDTDGRIVVTASNGIPPYQYSNDNGVTFQASNEFSGLAPATYNIVVRDSKNCDSAATSVVIDEPLVVTSGPVLTQGLTCGTGNAAQAATITINAGGGTPPYVYSFDGGVNFTPVNIFTTTTAGPVNTMVRDSRGCLSAVVPINIPALVPPTDLDFVATPVTCTNLTSDVTLTTTGGVGVLAYAILSPASATGNTTGAASGVFTGLAPDIYLFEVTDANGCTYEESYTVEDVTNITVLGVFGNDVTCNGTPTGAGSFTVGNFAGTYSYSINGAAAVVGQSATTINLPPSIAGTYTIVVTDETTDCTATDSVVINEPALLTLTETGNINANCNEDAQVTVEANFGTPGYTYAFVQDGVAPVPADFTSNATAFLNPATNTDWDVWAQDANGCQEQIDVTIATDPLPTVTAVVDNQCTGTSSFTITATPGAGAITPLSYSIDGGVSYQTSPVFTVSTAGSYIVTIRDGNNCTANTVAPIDVFAPLAANATLTKDLTCSLPTDASMDIEVLGGNGPYSYRVSIGGVAYAGPQIPFAGTTFTYNNATADTYQFEITDANSCTTETNVITTNATIPVTFTTTVIDVSCNSGNDGSITVNLDPGNDNPVYTYEIIAGPILRPSQTSNLFEDLVAGDYTVEVTSGKGCTNTAVVRVDEPLALTVSGTATPYTCAPDNSVNTSTLTINEGAGTGTAPYAYSIDGTNYFTTNTFDIIDTGVPQTINIFVRDNNGCIESNTVNIAPLPTLTAATVAVATPIDCNGTGSVDITVTGGSGNFTFQMLPSGTPQASNIFSITNPGTYHFQVNDLDTGCTIDASYEVLPFDTIDAVINTPTQVTCFTDNNGGFELNISGYTGPYNYDILDSTGASVRGLTAANTSTNPELVTGLTGGNYTVVVTETASPFCTTTSNVITIDSPASALTLVATETANVTCDNNVGTITAVASGGRTPYEYELTGAATVAYSPSGMFTNLSAGAYIVNVRDAGGCIVSDPITLNIPTPINATVTPSASLLSCFGDTNGTITVNATGGQGSNYSYTLNMVSPIVASSGPQTDPVFTNLGAGTYNVTVTDGYNCVFNSPNVVINEPTQIQTTLAKETSQTCLTNATLTLSATGGTGPYTYSDTPNFVTTLGSFATSVTFPVPVGSHVYYVRDANGCNANVSNEIIIDPLPALTVDLDSVNINCAGDNTGVITATAQGGLGNYVYTLQDTSGNDITPVTQNTPGVFTELVAGSYQVRVESLDCLITSARIDIVEPAQPLIADFVTTELTCPGADDGILQINASGGTGLIRYAISPRLDQFFETSTFENLAPGTYQAIAQDELGCFVFDTFTIGSPTPVLVSLVPGSLIPEVCEGDADGSFSIDISGGNLPYSVAIDDINGTYVTGTATQTQFDFDNLSGGDHIVYVRDARNCESEWTIAFPSSVRINPEAAVEYACTGNITTNTVTITVDASITDLTDLDYSLDGAPYQASNVFVNVPAGLDHYVDVRHTNGCIQRTEGFDIDQSDPLTLVLEDGGLNEIVAVTNGGSEPYEYTLNGESYGSTNTFLIYSSGDYTVTVTDRNGCIATVTRYFEYIDVCISNYFTPNGDNDQDEWGPGCTSQYKDLTFDIFDRYGRAIATLRVGEKWDGKYNNAELPTGDYWYILKLNDPKDNREFVGHFTLYR
ncbi:T9SS type B sorting domain-containing protein [Flavivirga abyssicola]|uniref:T9SS type B sorting domain-containing protein n=1 Tax=Flavivirga abyssicola TaxID=3063533 RepID=UPI0026E0660B|nr:T9SS type B sorting domain-containing protein [Flavivirga sp. MEBiC07777]WVK12760.1 T9SS type B sorting domain-containing protein [Flavivirga sp. MEBiC07777]